MVGSFTWFIAVWMNADIEQRRRHEALVVASDYLERVGAGVPTINNQDDGGQRKTNLQIQQVNLQQFWTTVPGWVGQLKRDEHPVISRVIVTGQLYGGRQITVQVTG